MPKPPKARLGIIAGGGALPVRLAEAAAIAGRDPYIVVLGGAGRETDFDAWPHVTIDVAAVGRILAALRLAGCAELVLAGTLQRPRFTDLRPDWRGLMLLPRVVAAARHGDDALLQTLVGFLEQEGFRVVGADQVLNDLLAPEGVLGLVRPGDADMADLARAGQVLLALGTLDVGQAVVVRDGQVLGIEAAEGTDRLIERCAGLQPAGRGGVLLKLSKTGQERRVDLPTIGTRTIELAAAARLAGIGIEAGAALILDRDKVAAAADAAGLFVVGLPRPKAN